MKQGSLFENEHDKSSPLADRVRPQHLDDLVGQKHLLEEGKVLREMIESDQVSSMIFWGHPGVGKTTLARIIANHTESKFVNFSAVSTGLKDIRKVINQVKKVVVFNRL